MKRFERIAAGALLTVGAGAAYLAVEMGYGSVRFPGPDSFRSGWLLPGRNAGIYLVACLGPDDTARPLWDPGTWRRPRSPPSSCWASPS